MFHSLRTGHRQRQIGFRHSPTGLHTILSGRRQRTTGSLRRRGRRPSPTLTPLRCRRVLRWTSWLRWASPTGIATSSCWTSTAATCRERYKIWSTMSTTGTWWGTRESAAVPLSWSDCFLVIVTMPSRLRSLAACSSLYTDVVLWSVLMSRVGKWQYGFHTEYSEVQRFC